MDTTTATAKVRKMTAQLSARDLSSAIVAVEQAPASDAKSLMHDWLSDELLTRLGEDAYDTYLFDYDEEGNPASPLKYLLPGGPTVLDELVTSTVAKQFLSLIAA